MVIFLMPPLRLFLDDIQQRPYKLPEMAKRQELRIKLKIELH